MKEAAIFLTALFFISSLSADSFALESDKESVKKNDSQISSSLNAYEKKQIDGYFTNKDSNDYDPYVSIEETFSLEEAIELALNNNFDLISQQARNVSR